MDITTKRKWQVRLAAVLIFLLGFAAGALALNAYKRWGRTAVARQGVRCRYEGLHQAPHGVTTSKGARAGALTTADSQPSDAALFA